MLCGVPVCPVQCPPPRHHVIPLTHPSSPVARSLGAPSHHPCHLCLVCPGRTGRQWFTPGRSCGPKHVLGSGWGARSWAPHAAPPPTSTELSVAPWHQGCPWVLPVCHSVGGTGSSDLCPGGSVPGHAWVLSPVPWVEGPQPGAEWVLLPGAWRCWADWGRCGSMEITDPMGRAQVLGPPHSARLCCQVGTAPGRGWRRPPAALLFSLRRVSRGNVALPGLLEPKGSR